MMDIVTNPLVAFSLVKDTDSLLQSEMMSCYYYDFKKCDLQRFNLRHAHLNF